MADIFTKSTRSYVMSRIHSKNTKPELLVRRFLFSNGFRYRLHRKDLPGNPDLVLPKYKTAIFINGCFWHGHSCKIGSGKRKPKSNRGYWLSKLERNKRRDRKNRRTLSSMGWKTIVLWECEVLKRNHIVKKLLGIKGNAHVWK